MNEEAVAYQTLGIAKLMVAYVADSNHDELVKLLNTLDLLQARAACVALAALAAKGEPKSPGSDAAG